MRCLTEENLQIYWPIQNEYNDHTIYHEEMIGVLAYGYWVKGKLGSLSFPYNVWPQATAVRENFLTGSNWIVLEWTIRIDEWPKPDVWCNILEDTLQVMCQSGAQIAWFGREGYFADPPYLFSPQYMADGVYAVLTPEQFLCSAHLGKPYDSISDDILLQLQTLIPQ